MKRTSYAIIILAVAVFAAFVFLVDFMGRHAKYEEFSNLANPEYIGHDTPVPTETTDSIPTTDTIPQM